MLRDRKGITPVIAIVLLLLVTVGAVGVVYSQFQSIVDQGSTEAEFLDQVNTKITVAQRNETTSPETVDITLENTGDSEYNLSDIARLEFSVPGEQTLRGESFDGIGGLSYDPDVSTCFSASDTQNLGPGEIATCNTGVQMPSATNQFTIQLTKVGADQTSVIDTYVCSPSTSSSTTC